MPAAVRLPRTVAVRRALLAGLFLVGFVALGFAFGPGAHADDRTAGLPGTFSPASAGSTAGQSSDQPSSQVRAVPADRATASPAKATAEAAAPVRAATRTGAPDHLEPSGTAVTRQEAQAGAATEHQARAAAGDLADTVRPAAERAVQVVDPVTGVVRQVGDAAGAVLPLPSGTHPGHPGDGGRPQHGGAPHGTPQGAAHRVGPAEKVNPSYVGGVRAKGAEGARSAARAPGAPSQDGASAPLPRVTFTPTSSSMGDGHGPRGDQHATCVAETACTGWVPGGAHRPEGAPTRHRPHDILEFPG
ncbi:hypothetical protein [Streptomyces benahoarensis]|uniref:Uncharacterized protein n=1 Tax=Streptomyces benahoarensis TaxID=2595054 RepID=A0A553YGG0_9ACTN|nr:hypothetical protein [Streptomyces benahoarensis]TSB19325.1 hypothetical protein FNJ62_22640 [Streptomyces benahoarensis]TSB28294.1 hypothetical protein FNZ23_26605 [Streptomyces benahoarensis]